MNLHMDLSWTVIVNFVTLYGVKVLASLLIFFVGKKIALYYHGHCGKGDAYFEN